MVGNIRLELGHDGVRWGRPRGCSLSVPSTLFFFLCVGLSINSLSLISASLFPTEETSSKLRNGGPATGGDTYPSWVWPETLPWLRTLSGPVYSASRYLFQV